jgi:hypothetical protein
MQHQLLPQIPRRTMCLQHPLILIVLKTKDKNVEDLPLQVPLVNIMTSADDLRVASMRVEEVQEMIKK